jgi:MBG domain-containing protein
VTVSKINQTITVMTAAPATAAYGSQFTVAATSSSGLAVTYGASGGCTNTGATFTIISSTTACTVTYSQSGNGNYNVAPNITSNTTATTAPLTITANNQSKTYGQNLSLGTTAFTATGLVFGQTVGSVTLTSSGAAASATVGGSPYAIVPGAATGGTFTPSNYTLAYVNGLLTVSPATPTVSTWPTASQITYGQRLTNSNLSGGSASVPGSFAFANPTTAPNAGTSAQSVTFTPSDSTDYTVVTGTVNVTVNKATPTISAWPTASQISYGQTLSLSTLSGGTASVPGTFAFTSPNTAPNVGTANQSVTFTPTDSIDYSNATGNVSVTVNKANQTITVTTPAPASADYGAQFTVAATASSGLAVTYGASGGCTRSGATFTMTSSTTACTVTYSQAGNGSYNAAPNVTSTTTANKATTTTAVTAGNPAKQGNHYNVTVNFTVAPEISGTPTGQVSVSINDGSGTTCSASLAGGKGSCQLSNLSASGTWTLTGSYVGDTSFTGSIGTTSVTIP